MDELTWRWTPIPHLDVMAGLSPGELLLNALLYALAVVIVGGVLLGAAAATKTVGGSFREGYRKARR